MKTLTTIVAVLSLAPAEAVNCNQAVSLVAHMNNDQCQALCSTSSDPTKDPAYTQYCAIAHYSTKNGRVVPSHPCMTNVVYGYTASTSQSTRGQIVAGDGSTKDPATPAECQLACQQDDDCQRWGYNVDTNECVLKSRDAVKSALDPSSDYCPVTVQQACDAKLYDCLTCNGKVGCAWHSATDLSGWKYCASSEDACLSPKYAVCDRQASISANVTNTECQAQCNTILGEGATIAELEANQTYNSICAEQSYRTTNGRAVPTGDCYNNMVYGLVQDDNHASLVTDLVTSTPALCQAECQAVDQCISFSWVSDIASKLTGTTVGQCLLKSAEMLSKAKELDGGYCNAGTATYGWLKCEGKEACAWASSYHISGQRSCANVTSLCRIMSTLADAVEGIEDIAATQPQDAAASLLTVPILSLVGLKMLI